MLKNVLTYLIVILLAATAAAAQAYLAQSPKPVAKVQTVIKTEPESAEAKADRPIRLAPIIANLSLPEGMWVRVDVVLIAPHQFHKEVDSTSVKITQDFLVYLQTLSISDLEGVHSLAFLRQELIERARIRSENKVKDVLVTTMVVQ